MSKEIMGAGLGACLGHGKNEPKILMDKQIVFHPQNSGANVIKAKVEINKYFSGATLKAGVSLKDNSFLGALLHEFAGEFMLNVAKEEEIRDARLTLDEFHMFITEFVMAAGQALDMYPEMAKKEEPQEHLTRLGETLADFVKQTPKDYFGHLLTEYLDKKTLDELKEMAAKKDIDLGNVSDDKATLVFVIAKSSLENWEHELPAGTTDAKAIAEFIIG
jgi:hypothetical protein